MNEVNKKLKNLINNFNFKREELGEIRKMYSGEFFDPKDRAYLRLLRLSKELCVSYSALCERELEARKKSKKRNLSPINYLKFYFAKLKILKALFPIHGGVLYAEKGISAVIGLVDLKGYGFINKNVTFSPYTLTKVGKSAIFAFEIMVGSEQPQECDGLIKLDRTVIDKNCWICAGAHVAGGVKVGKNSVVAGGARLLSSVEENTLAAGRPAKPVKKIPRKTREQPPDFYRTKSEIDAVSQYMYQFYGKIHKDIQNMYSCKRFNSLSKNLKYAYALTRELCGEYSAAGTTKERKRQILDTLFICGEDVEVGEGVYVDMLGTVILGDGARIGKNVYLGGNVIIGKNAVLGDGVIAFASGHSIVFKERIAKYSPAKGIYEYTQYGYIRVADGASVGNGAFIAPNSVILRDVPADGLFVCDKIV